MSRSGLKNGNAENRGKCYVEDLSEDAETCFFPVLDLMCY